MAELSKEAIANIAMRVGMPSFYPDELVTFARACYEAGRVAEMEEAAKLREMLEDLSKAVWLLDQKGFIWTWEDEAECQHLRGIALQEVDAYRAYVRARGVKP